MKNWTRCLLKVGVRDWECLGASPSMIQKGFCEKVADVMDAEAEGEDDIHPSKKPRVEEGVLTHVPPDVESLNRDFDVNDFLRSSPNPVVASVFGDSEKLRRAAVHRGYPIMKSQFLNFGDDIHDQSVRERIMATVQRIQPLLLVLAFPSRVWSPILNYATSPRLRENERQSWQSWIGWFPCAKCRKQLGTCFSWKILWVPRVGTSLLFRDFGTLLLCSKTCHTCACSGSRIRGAAEPSRDPSGT